MTLPTLLWPLMSWGFFLKSPVEFWSFIRHYSVLNSLECLLSSLPVGTDGATFTTITCMQSPGSWPTSSFWPMSCLWAFGVTQFHFYFQILFSWIQMYVYMLNCGWIWATPTQNHSSPAMIGKRFIIPGSSQLRVGTSHAALNLLWKYTCQSPTLPSSTDMSGFHFRLISHYIIISC